MWVTLSGFQCVRTVELGLGQNAPTQAESVFPVADIEG